MDDSCKCDERVDIRDGNDDMKDIDDFGYLPRILEILNKK